MALQKPKIDLATEVPISVNNWNLILDTSHQPTVLSLSHNKYALNSSQQQTLPSLL